MSFFDFISDKQKKLFLQSSRESLALELAQILVRLNIDPETFDLDAFDPKDHEDYGEVSLRIAQIRDAINLTNTKLDALG